MEDTSWIMLYRKILDDGIMKNPKLLQFFIWCLLKASHKKHDITIGFQSITLEPGQLIFGRKNAAKELKSTERKIRNCLEYFSKKDVKMTIKTTNKFSIITICEYNKYQNPKNYFNHQNDQQATNKRPTSDQQTTINNNVNNGNNENNGNKKQYSPPAHLLDVWEDYLKTRNKKRAANTYTALNGIVKDLEKLAPNNLKLQNSILKESIKRGWIGVFPLKDDFNNNKPKEFDFSNQRFL